MKNRFDHLYGNILRSYAKAIITEVGQIEGISNPNLTTIGVLEYLPFDNSFYYSPTLISVFKYPDEIDEVFPTSNDTQWTPELMICLGKYLAEKKNNKYIEEIFSENEELELKGASMYNNTLENFHSFKQIWLKWYDENILSFKKIESNSYLSESQRLNINRLFHFSNFLLTIVKRPAYIRSEKDNLSNSESFYRLIFNQSLPLDYKDEKFNQISCNYKAVHEKWNHNENSQEFHSELIFILEVCYKQPFAVYNKISIISNILNGSYNKVSYYFNAVAISLISNGEFLGVTYITWPSSNKEESEQTFESLSKRIRNILRNSRIAGFLYKAKISTTRYALQKTNYREIKVKSAIYRVFEKSHLFNNSPIIAMYSDNSKAIKGLVQKGISHKLKHIKGFNVSKSDLVNILSEISRVDKKSILNNPCNILEFHPSGVDKSKETLTKKRDAIIRHNKTLFSVLENSDFTFSKNFHITSVTVLNLEHKSHNISIFLFNSNYHTVNNSIKGNNLEIARRSYALEKYNYFVEFLEVEEFTRKLIEQENDLWQEMDSSFFHYVKSTLEKKQNTIYFSKSHSPIRKLDLIKKSSDLLVSKIQRLLDIFKMGTERPKTSVNKIKKLWDRLVIENADIPQLKIGDTYINLRNDIEIVGCIKSLEMIFEEIYLNAINYSNNQQKEIILNLTLKKEAGNLNLEILNRGTTIPLKKRSSIGFPKTGGPDENAGLGFTIINKLLRRMGAIQSTNSLFFKMEYEERGAPQFFKLIFKLELI